MEKKIHTLIMLRHVCLYKANVIGLFNTYMFLVHD